MNDKMREEFEAWYEGVTGLPVEFNDAGIPASIGSALSETVTMGMWVAWRASRESLCVELPLVFSNDRATTYLTRVINALDSAGVRYK